MEKYFILINSTKTLNLKSKQFESQGDHKPLFQKLADVEISKMKNWDINQITNQFQISKKLADDVVSYLRDYNKVFYRAINFYNGPFYKQFEISENDFKWLDQHVRIIDGLYGILKPSDLISPYRFDISKKMVSRENLENWIKIYDSYFEGYNLYSLMSEEFKLPFKNFELIDLSPVNKKNIKVKRGLVFKELLEDKSEPKI